MSDVATAALSLMLHLGKPDVDTPWWHPNRLRVHHRVVSESQAAVDLTGVPVDAGAVATPPPNQAFRCRPQAPYPSNDFTCDEPINPISSPAPSRTVGPGDVAEAAEEMELPSLRVSVQPAGSQLTVTRTTEQANVIVGGTGLTATDPRRFTLSVLNAVLGGGMSSRLFQEVREKRGLAYSTYSFASGHADTGVFGLYAGCAPGKVDEVLDLTRAELAAVAAKGVTTEELARGKGMAKGAYVLGLEDTGSRMSRIAKSEMLYDDLMSVDELLARVDAVTLDEVNQVAAELFGQPMSLAIVGPL